MIGQRLIHAGLIQFGAFPRNGDVIPFDLALPLVASYPDLLRDLANTAAERLDGVPMTRLLATSEAVPFGVALSLRLGVPLVYSKGMGSSPVDDLVGAYDIGHPALLVTNSVGFDHSVEALVKGARRVGLEVHTLVTLLEGRPPALEELGVNVISLARLGDLVDQLLATGDIPRRQAALIHQWITR